LIKRFYVFALIAFCVNCSDSAVDQKTDFVVASEVDPDTDCVLAYQALLLEEELGFNSKPEVWAVLDDLLNLEPQFQYRSNLSRDEKILLLAQFEEHLNNKRKLIGEYHNIMGICLEWGIYDCDINSMLFHSWGERWGIPIDLHLLPKHMSVSIGDEEPIYWETTMNKTVPFSYYERRYKVSEEDVHFRRPLSEAEIQAVLYFNIAKEYLDRGNNFRLLNGEEMVEVFEC